MTKVIKGEFEKLESVKISNVSLTCNTSLEIFNEEFNRMSRMEDDLFTYKVEIAEVTNIPCDLKKEDDSKQQMSHESDNDMECDPSDARGDDEVELTDEESSDSDDEDEVANIFRIETNVFEFKTPLCRAFKEFNYLLQIDPDVLTKDIDGFKTYEEYKDDWIYEWNKDVPLVHETPWTKNGVWKEPTLVKHHFLEDMDAYRNEGMGDVIFGEPFFREVRINARRFEGMIIVYNGNEEVTYQMVRSHPRFKRHTNEHCNKIPPLLKVSEEDKMNGISHSYQKLKSFYKGVLNLRSEYV
ncbi:hypothetical protein Tco_1375743 [Tanacetum coccineum]